MDPSDRPHTFTWMVEWCDLVTLATDSTHLPRIIVVLSRHGRHNQPQVLSPVLSLSPGLSSFQSTRSQLTRHRHLALH